MFPYTSPLYYLCFIKNNLIIIKGWIRSTSCNILPLHIIMRHPAPHCVPCVTLRSSTSPWVGWLDYADEGILIEWLLLSFLFAVLLPPIHIFLLILLYKIRWAIYIVRRNALQVWIPRYNRSSFLTPLPLDSITDPLLSRIMILIKLSDLVLCESCAGELLSTQNGEIDVPVQRWIMNWSKSIFAGYVCPLLLPLPFLPLAHILLVTQNDLLLVLEQRSNFTAQDRTKSSHQATISLALVRCTLIWQHVRPLTRTTIFNILIPLRCVKCQHLAPSLRDSQRAMTPNHWAFPPNCSHFYGITSSFFIFLL